jgi:beta-glucosidase
MAILLPDGTGEPNEEGLNYYNSLIDALLDKGIPSTFLVSE